MDLIVIYSGDFGEKVVGNLINYSTFCISCAEACTHCKEGKYSFADRIKGIFKLPAPSLLPVLIEDSMRAYVPKELPKADIAIVTEIHTDLLLELPRIGDTILHKAGYIIRAAVEEGVKQSESIDYRSRKGKFIR